MRIPSILLFLMIFTSVSGRLASQNETPLSILKASADRCMQIKSMKFTLKMQERVKGKIIYSETYNKVSYAPHKVYLKQYKPRVGMEILYCEGERNNCMLIYTNGFPWVNLTYSPYAHMVHKESHHNITRSGLRYIGKMMGSFLNTNTKDYNINMLAEEVVDGKLCYKMTIEHKDFRFIPHIIKKGESIHSIADQLLFSPNLILENNLSVVDDYDEALVEGQKIMIPNAYGKKIVMWIDKKSLLPIKFQIDDHKGFYEIYEYQNIQLNPVFKEGEFTEDYEEYEF